MKRWAFQLKNYSFFARFLFLIEYIKSEIKLHERFQISDGKRFILFKKKKLGECEAADICMRKVKFLGAYLLHANIPIFHIKKSQVNYLPVSFLDEFVAAVLCNKKRFAIAQTLYRTKSFNKNLHSGNMCI